MPDSPGSVLAQPRKDIVYLLHLLYLAPGPLDAIRCVAQTRRRTRCPATLLDPPDTAPWFSLSVPPAPRDDHLTGSLTGTVMLARDLTHLAYHEQLRWRYQRCRQHAAGLAADVILPQWLPFDAFAHHQHIVTIRPAAPETGTSA